MGFADASRVIGCAAKVGSKAVPLLDPVFRRRVAAGNSDQIRPGSALSNPHGRAIGLDRRDGYILRELSHFFLRPSRVLHVSAVYICAAFFGAPGYESVDLFQSRRVKCWRFVFGDLFLVDTVRALGRIDRSAISPVLEVAPIG